MKVAVASSGSNLEAKVEPRFGRCAYFVVVDADTMQFEALENPGVVAGTVGPNALEALKSGGLKLYGAAGGTVAEAAGAAAAGDLEALI